MLLLLRAARGAQLAKAKSPPPANASTAAGAIATLLSPVRELLFGTDVAAAYTPLPAPSSIPQASNARPPSAAIDWDWVNTLPVQSPNPDPPIDWDWVNSLPTMPPSGNQTSTLPTSGADDALLRSLS